MEPKVSVIIPYFGKPIEGCLESVKVQTYANIELLAGSESDFGIKEKKGAGFMRNFLAEKATGEILFFMDADAVLKEDAIGIMVQIFREVRADAVSCLPMAPEAASTLNYVIGLEYEENIGKMEEGFVTVAATTGLGVTKEAFSKLGGFITTFRAGIGEDWDLTSRMIRNGYKIWHSNRVVLYHHTAETFRKYLKKQFRHAWYRVEHMRKFRQASDEYANRMMFAQSFLWATIPFQIAIAFFQPIFWATTYVTLNLIFAWKIYFWSCSIEGGRITTYRDAFRALYILPLTFVRSLVWLFGAAQGVWDFYIRRR